VPDAPECLRLIYTRLSDVHAGASVAMIVAQAREKPKHVTLCCSLTCASIGNHILLPKRCQLANRSFQITCFNASRYFDSVGIDKQKQKTSRLH
jgi:hypothetical protein